jgi:DNA-directed RNA polymerase subunit alpha
MVEKKYVTYGTTMPEKIQKIESTDFYGKYEIEPFERGFGITVGNALRYGLINLIEGAAVYSVYIKDVDSIYSDLDNVKESVAEIIQNIKLLTIDLGENETGILTLNVSSSNEKVIKAESLTFDDSISIKNPDLKIATLKNGQFYMELFVNKGKGYVECTEHEESGIKLEKGFFIDSIYTPISKVNYEVLKTRVGQSTDYDKIMIEIFSNGIVTPEDAVEIVTEYYKNCLSNLINFEEKEAEPEEPEVSPEMKKLMEILKIGVDEMELSVRSNNCLREAGIKTLGELVVRTEIDMMQQKNFGKKSLYEIKDKLNQFGLNFGMTNLKDMVVSL